jgi:hypothetical protein
MPDSTAEGRSASEPRKESLSDVLRHLTEAARVAASLGEDKLHGLIADVKDQGAKVAQKGEEMAKRAKQGVARQRDAIEERTIEAIAATLARANVATKDDIARLERQIEELARRMAPRP